ncbi:MAG: hypothetical protein R2772_11815 [Chitinophagales bacterium]
MKIKFLYTLLLSVVAVSFSKYTYSSDSFCLLGNKLPFVSIGSKKNVDVIVNTKGEPVCLSDGKKLLSGFIPSFYANHLSNPILIGRDHISGHMRILSYFNNTDTPKELEIGLDVRTNLYVQSVFSIGDRLLMVSYNVFENSPSGRLLSGVSETNKIHEIHLVDNALSFELLADSELPSGLDVAVHTAKTKEKNYVCIDKHCLVIAHKNRSLHVLNKLELNREATLLELASDEAVTWGLFQRDYDDRFTNNFSETESIFFVCKVGAMDNCQNIESSQIPYRLSVKEGKVFYKVIESSKDLVDLLEYDLSRLRGDGLANFAENNLEGRIAWSSVYYLNGLLTASELGKNYEEFKVLADDINRRINFEISTLVKFDNYTYPWYYAKRYAIDREPIASIVHLGRILRVLSRAAKRYPAEPNKQVIRGLIDELIKPEKVIETFSIEGKQKHGAEIRIRKYMPFWADGTNVPWNYQSAWINGLAESGEIAKNPALRNYINQLLSIFIEKEELEKKPTEWNYAGGVFQSGWSRKDAVSNNTPDYSGNKINTQTAHISYRSMDAMALSYAYANKLSVIDKELIKHIRFLVSTGYLYPFVNEVLENIALEATIPFYVARQYARSTIPHQLQNQIWALKALSKKYQ